ncbi:MAG: VUT family protein [Kofleriaceae bacterium]
MVLAALFVGATIALPLWFASAYVADLSRVPIDLAGASELTLGVLVFPVALIAGQLICELYGTRRALLVTLLATLASAGIVIASQHGALADPAELPLALVVCATLANLINVLVFAGATRALDGGALWLRSFVATPVALLIGWAAFAGTWVALGNDVDAAVAMASAPCLYACACALAGIVVLVTVKALLREAPLEAPPVEVAWVQPRRRAPALTIEEAESEPIALTRVIRRPMPVPMPMTTAPFKPYTTGELAFFAEGDEMSELGTTAV